jgi:hypothetical protein
MAQAKRHYSTFLPEEQAQEFEALASSLGLSFSEAFRRAATIFLAVQATTPAPEPEPLPEPVAAPEKPPTSPEAVADHAQTVRDNAPIEVYRRIHKRKPAVGAYLEVYPSPDGFWFYQFAYRDPSTLKVRRKSCGKFQSSTKAAEARDATARIFCDRLGIIDEPMNFPREGEVDARTGKIVSDF